MCTYNPRRASGNKIFGIPKMYFPRKNIHDIWYWPANLYEYVRWREKNRYTILEYQKTQQNQKMCHI